MQFEPHQIYHIYNQGNNKQKVFYSDKNYIFFLEKIKKHILPFADILAWCLMPNHFHLMLYVKENADTHPMTSSHRMSNHNTNKTIQMSDLSQSIAIMLRSYTRAINKQEQKTGSLFRPHTKAICLSKAETITPSYFNSNYGTYLNISIPEKEYPQKCFQYIHQNPVNANLVDKEEDWEFSSYKDYCGLRNGKLINKKLAIDLLLI